MSAAPEPPPSSPASAAAASLPRWTRRTSVAPLPAWCDGVVLFDGRCKLCDGTVAFLIARDGARRRLRYCALQSAAAAPVLAAFGLSREAALASIVYVEGGVAYRKSAAAAAIAARLPLPWAAAAAAARCVPDCLADALYDAVSRNRYAIWGEYEDCMRPTADVRSRFIDDDAPASSATGRAKAE